MSEPGKVTSRAQVECLYRGGAGWKESVNMDEINKGKNMAESQAQGFLILISTITTSATEK